MNLLQNAIKSSKPDCEPILIFAELIQEVDEKILTFMTQLQIKIQDRGKGISNVTKADVFDAYLSYKDLYNPDFNFYNSGLCMRIT